TYDAAGRLGINMGLVTKAAMGQKGAITQLNQQLNASHAAHQRVVDSIGKFIPGSQQFGSQTQANAEAVKQANDALNKNSADINTIRSATGTYTEAIRKQIQASKQLSRIDKQVVSTSHDQKTALEQVKTAVGNFDQALSNVHDALKTTNVGIKGNSALA